MPDEKPCFVIAPIGSSESDTRKRSDKVLKYIIRPAVEACGYRATRADEIDAPGIITSQVIQRIVNDPLVIADLTERNPNVFYELAVRHALRKPLIQIIQKGEQMPFDVAGMRTIQVDHQDLESVEETKLSIIDQVKSLESSSADIETPISMAYDLQLLRQSEKPEDRSLADLVTAVGDLRTGLSKIESRVGSKEQQVLLDEIQTELHKLSSRLDGCSEFAPAIWRDRKHSALHELLHFHGMENPAVGILMVAGIFRDTMPWLSELGLEVYRLARSGKSRELDQVISDFRKSIEFVTKGPIPRDIFGKNRELYYLLTEEVESLLNRLRSKEVK